MRVRRLTTKQFKTVLSRKASTDNIILAKQMEAEVEAQEDRVIKFTISTGDVDRDNDTIDPSGWDLENFQKIGTVLWAHEPWTPPIAKPRNTKVEGNKLVSDAVFLDKELADHDHVRFADMVYQMYKNEIMKTVSVGFLPRKWIETEERGGFFPVDFVEQELLEYSAVPVPSNPNAFMEAAKAGHDVELIGRWAMRKKDQAEQFGGLWVPNSLLDELSKVTDYTIDVIDIEEKSVISFEDAHSEGTPLAEEDEDWDGPEEVAQASVEDLKVMCAWYDAEDEENKGAYKLPHHKAGEDNACVWRGVVAAMAALSGARAELDVPEEDRKGIYDHLVKHYKAFDKEPPAWEDIQSEVSEDQEGQDTEEEEQSASDDKSSDLLYEFHKLAAAIAQKDELNEVERSLFDAGLRLFSKFYSAPDESTEESDHEDQLENESYIELDDSALEEIDFSLAVKEWEEEARSTQSTEFVEAIEDDELHMFIKEALNQAIMEKTGKLPS